MRFMFLTVLLAGCPRPYEFDPIEISSRYENRDNGGPCPSWLFSHKTGYRYCASPAVVVNYPQPIRAAVVKPPIDETQVDQASLMAHGETVYADTCAVCHQADGKGTAGVFPPLAGAGSFYGDPKNHATIVLKGLSGVEVLGVSYASAMPPQDHLSDYDLAAVLTFERNSWGNADGIVLPDDVKAAR